MESSHSSVDIATKKEKKAHKRQQNQFQKRNEHRSRHSQYHTYSGPVGYSHINDELIFIERDEHSPYRQEPPAGYEYKGKIEVENTDREYRTRSRSRGTVIPVPPPLPLPPSVPFSQSSAPAPSIGPCPPGWQQVILTAAPGGPCPPGTTTYTAQAVGATNMFQGSSSGTGQVPHSGGLYLALTISLLFLKKILMFIRQLDQP